MEGEVVNEGGERWGRERVKEEGVNEGGERWGRERGERERGE